MFCCLLCTALLCYLRKTLSERGRYRTSGQTANTAPRQPTTISSSRIVESANEAPLSRTTLILPTHAEGGTSESPCGDRCHTFARTQSTATAIGVVPTTPNAETSTLTAERRVGSINCEGVSGAIFSLDESFEGAITRLAAAVGLGTEQLVYVRRVDVAEVVDALVNQAQKSGGVRVTSPALERLAILRYSERSTNKSDNAGFYVDGSHSTGSYSSRSFAQQARAASMSRKKLCARFDAEFNSGTEEKRAKLPPVSSMPPPPPRLMSSSDIPPEDCSGNDSKIENRTSMANITPASTSASTPAWSSPSTITNFRGSTVSSDGKSADKTAGTKRWARKGWAGADLRRSLQGRSPPPPPPPPSCTTTGSTNRRESPTNRASPPSRTARRRASPTNRGSPTSRTFRSGRASPTAKAFTDMMTSPKQAGAQSRVAAYAAAATALKLETSGNKDNDNSAHPLSSQMPSSPATGGSNTTQITFVPLTPRIANGAGAGAGAFDDFWTSGWVD